ncbi:MAG: hypothetical protein GF411_03960 [Candidatus Lokiarchaeota archaeon]|nr:hypothetical protein [Candidatus Lokiarchaeota archaeon]
MKLKEIKAVSLLFLGVLVFSAMPLGLLQPTIETPITPIRNTKPAAFNLQSYEKVMNVTTFVSPDGSKDALWWFLNAAEESIYVEIYGVNNPYILDLIHDLHDTKPSLDMKFLLGWNSLGYYSENDYVANNLTLLGYEVKWTNDTDFTYAHQKFVVIDNETTLVHSGNWAKTSFPDFKYKANREWSIALNDSDVTSYYRSVFDYDWMRGIDYNATEHGTGSALTYPTTTSTYDHPFAEAGNFYELVNVTPVFSPDTSLQAILYCINSAKYTLDIQIPYFTSIGDAGEVDQVVDAILDARARGVTVRVISEEEKDYLEIAELFYNHSIPVVWHDTRWFTAEHNKGIIVDGHMVLLSSINFSDGSISENREAGVIIDNYNITQWYLEIFDFDWELGDGDENMGEVNLYWTPNIPTSSDVINVSIFAQRHYSDVTDVNLSVQIDTDPATNYSITTNVYPSIEGQDENYFYEISAQPHGTNITVQGFIKALGVWHNGTPMVIHVLDSTDGVTLDSPADFEYESGSTGHTITWTGSAENPDKYEVLWNGTHYTSGNWGGNTVGIAVNGLAVGKHNFTCIVNDTTGAFAIDTVWITVTPAEAPEITGPDDFLYEEGISEYVIYWNFTDQSPDTLIAYYNNAPILTQSYASEDSLVYDAGNLSEGDYNLTIWLNDTLGLESGNTVLFTVNASAAPNIIGPADVDYEYGTTSYDLRWDFEDVSPDTYLLYKNGSLINSGTYDTAGMIEIDVGQLDLGVYNYTLWMNDTLGHISTDTVLVTCQDTTIPTIDHPIDRTLESGPENQSIVWNPSDLDPDSYEIMRNGTIVQSGNWLGGSITLDFVPALTGVFNFTIIVSDGSSNTITDTVMVTIEDTTEPTISHPEDFEDLIDNILPVISWDVEDFHPGNYSIYVDDQLVDSGSWTNDESIEYQVNILTPGTYEIRIVVSDSDGNTVQDVVNVTIREPGITDNPLFYPIIGAVVVVVLGLLGCLNKKK